MSHSLNSLKGGHIGGYVGDYYRVIKGDTRSLDYSVYHLSFWCLCDSLLVVTWASAYLGGKILRISHFHVATGLGFRDLGLSVHVNLSCGAFVNRNP